MRSATDREAVRDIMSESLSSWRSREDMGSVTSRRVQDRSWK